MTQLMKKAGEPVSLARLDRKIIVCSTRLRIAVLLASCLFPALAWAQSDIWLGGAGNWSDPSKWSAGVPAASSNVFIDHGKAGASPVALDINGLATNLTVDSDDSLSLNNGVSLSIGATGGGTITNGGHLNINSTGTQTSLIVVNAGGAGVTLTGGGTLNMSNSTNNIIGPIGGVLINVNNTIQGAGHVGNTQMTLNNQGTINANFGGPGKIASSLIPSRAQPPTPARWRRPTAARWKCKGQSMPTPGGRFRPSELVPRCCSMRSP